MIIKYPLATEKSIKKLESENQLVFVVDAKADKLKIKEEVERLFKAKVLKVNTTITPKGVKKAFVTFSDETPAIDVATKLGMM